MKKVFVLLCSLIVLDLLPLNAQKVWSLQECISYALENNLMIKRQELNVQYSKNNHSQSYFNVLPNLNGQVNYGFSSGKNIDYSNLEYVNQNYWSGSGGLSSSITLFGGFQTINNILKTKYDFLKSQSDLQKSKNDISLQLALAYLQVLFSKEIVDAADNKLQLTSMQVNRTQKLLDVGNVAQGEYLQIKAQEANDKTNLINAQNSSGIAYLDLTQLLDLDSTGGFEIMVPANLEVELLAELEPLQSIYQKALETMPQIKSAEYALKSAEKQLSIAWGSASPSIDLNGALSSRYSQVAENILDPTSDYKFRDQVKDFYYKQFTIGVNIPIFNRMQVKNNISNSKLSVQDYELQLDQTKMALYKQVQQAHTDATDAREKYYSSVEALNYNQEAFKYTSQKMDVGLVNSVDFFVAQNNLVSATSNMLQAKYEYIFKLKILDLYMGKTITL